MLFELNFSNEKQGKAQMVCGIDANLYFMVYTPNKDVSKVDALLYLNWGN